MIGKVAFFFAAVLLAGGVEAGPNLVTNGSFESGLGGIGSFTGWTTALGDSATFVDSSGQTGTHYGQATDGLWAAYFGSTAADGGASISQTLATVIGQRYELGFDLANDTGGLAAANQFIAAINGLSLYTLTNGPVSNYVHIVESFIATGASTTLRFTGFNDQSYLEIDRITVAAVPEPDAAVLTATGALLMGIARRRKARASADVISPLATRT